MAQLTVFMLDAKRQVDQWVEKAEVGETLTYHVGLLALDREGNDALDMAAKVLMELSAQGEVQLTQKRVGPGVCVYIARRIRA